MRRTFELLALTPPTIADPAVAIAACRAGGTGLLDLEFLRAPTAALRPLTTLARLARRPWGVRLDSRRPDFAHHVLRGLDASAGTVVLTPAGPAILAGLVAAARSGGARVLVEATSAEEADCAERAGADGLVAKGNEAAGRIGEETAFVLLQRLVRRGRLPVFVQGGIGLHTAAAAWAGGAAGALLDAQLWLTRESPLSRAAKDVLLRMDGSETAVVGAGLGEPRRIYFRPGLAPGEQAVTAARALEDDRDASLEDRRNAWLEWMLERAGCDDPRNQVWPLGQDAAFARPLARRFLTVAGVLDGVRSAIDDHASAARAQRPLDRASALARSHGTEYPIVQGPMTRVSDRAEFALEVARGGGLPFLALALMRADEARRLLEETRRLLGALPWGVGILGFVPLELRQEQMEAIRGCRPPFALIAGGRPDQALALEQDGITTYLHVPSPGLLKLFLDAGARRFVFEGRECGGHVGPRSSFVLWDSMIETLLEELPPHRAADCHVLFAGGVHDALSASMVATMASPLAERGVKLGVLLGTAYLFTPEAVSTGAVVRGFQEAALGCRRTVLLESGPGHATRCVDSSFADVFETERRRLLAEGAPAEEIRQALEALNLGRLRIAAKGVDRDPRFGKDPAATKLRDLGSDEQRDQGLFMIGQVAALRDETVSIADLHREVAVGATERLETVTSVPVLVAGGRALERPSDVAIVGMSCLLPKAPDLLTYWRNILAKLDAVTEVPDDRWDAALYYDPNRTVKDKVYSKWGGFIDDTPFDPVRYGITPNSIPSIEPVQLLLLDVVRAGLADAGYADRPFPRQRTSVILGAGGGIGELGSVYAFRSLLPSYFADVPPEVLAGLPDWTEDSFPGILLNVAAGRVANRFDLGGTNFTVDAACASSLAAVHLAVRELETGSSDMVITGGIDTAQNPFMFLCFSKTHAHSPRGRCRTFDESADGIAISEGLAVLVLKRLADAERDGDRIYAVIKAVGASSDGRDRGLTAPRPEGQMLALERAYGKAGVSPAGVGLIEAHGTGTVAGDQAEATTLKRVFDAAGAARQGCAIGSVKSMIGHTKCTAGVAGMVKVALALHHKVLPPTLHVEKPNAAAAFPTSPFYVNTEARPWVAPPDGALRRAGVSAFGFGGTNFHAVLEEYRDGVMADPPLDLAWPAELFVWRGRRADELASDAEAVAAAIGGGARPDPAELAAALWRRATERDGHPLTLAIVAASIEDLASKIGRASERLRAGADAIADPAGIHFTSAPLGAEGKVAFLFPGQGSQSIHMLRDLTLHFHEVRGAFEEADRILMGRLPEPLSGYVYPIPTFSSDEERARQAALTTTFIAQPALGAASLGLLRLLEGLGLRGDMAAGHSYGEYVALCAAGAIDSATLLHLSERRGRCIVEAAGGDLGTMAAVVADASQVEETIRGVEGAWIANLNAPRQTVISGTRPGVERAMAVLAAKNLATRLLPVACAFHSPVIAGARDRLAAELETARFDSARFDVYSNSTAAPYPSDPREMRNLLADHLVKPVRFAEQVAAMHRAGARVFVEIGPRNVLTGLTQQVLGDRPHLALATDLPGQHGVVQLLGVLAQLSTHGVKLDLEPLFAGRTRRELNLATLVEDTRPTPLPKTSWLINGSYARPMSDPRRRLQPFASEPVRAAAPALPGLAATDASEVLGQYQDLMVRFLETQRTVMQAYLEGRPPDGVPVSDRTAPRLAVEVSPEPRGIKTVVDAPAPPVPPAAPPVIREQSLTRRLVAIVAERTGYPLDMIDLDARIEADLGIDSIKRVEILGALQREVGPDEAARLQGAMERLTRAQSLREVVDAATESPSASAPGPVVPAGDLKARLVEIVSERTGYPRDMIDLDARIEADLGIDSIKRVEILGALQRIVGPAEAERLQAAMERLTRAQSLREVVDVATESPSASVPGPVVPAEDLTARLVAIVSERTGYPRDMIDLDARIEADLGIDSIKRVEILGVLQRDGSAELAARLQPLMEALTRAGTLRAILEVLDADKPSPAAAAPIERAAPIETAAPRFVVRLREVPCVAQPSPRLPRGTLLITDDQKGVASALALVLREAGGSPVLLRPGVAPHGEATEDVVHADLTNPVAVEKLVAQLLGRSEPLRGIIHLLPLGTTDVFDGMEFEAWKSRMDREVKSLFHLSKGCAAALRAAADSGGAWVLAALAMGGGFAFEGSADEGLSPGHGGIAGLVKTLAVEWPGVRCVAVDVGDQRDPDVVARRLLHEMLAGDSATEVGYRDGRRFVPWFVPAPLAPDDASLVSLDSRSVVLLTGGACGITAEVGCELASRYRPTLVLVGRSPLPGPEEDPATANLRTPEELKAVVIDIMRRSGQNLRPAEVEQELRRLLREREIRRNVAEMRRHGARVSYVQADLRDDGAVRSLLAELYREYGRIDGVIHGAGLIEDRLVVDKTPQSFDRVFDTKADSAFLLARYLRPESLAFFAAFSSVAGRFGNQGQCDYAAANEVLNKLMAVLDRRWPGRVVAMNWGPWADSGMASPDVRREFEARGVKLVSLRSGRSAALAEIERGAKGEVEVILGDGPWRELHAPVEAPARVIEQPLPLLTGLIVAPRRNGRAELTRILDPAVDLYLADHLLDGKPVLPAAVAVELMSETVHLHWPGWEVTAVESFQMLNGVVINDGPRSVRVLAEQRERAGLEREKITVETSILDSQDGRLFYRATVVLARAIPEAPSLRAPDTSGFQPFPMSVEQAYDRWLFHGPTLQGIESLEGMGETGIAARLSPSVPVHLIKGATSPHWIFDPKILDSAFQLTLLFARARTDMTPLPARFRILRRFAPMTGASLRCVVSARTNAGGDHLETETLFLDTEGQLVARLENAEFTASRALNRLAGQWMRGGTP